MNTRIQRGIDFFRLREKQSLLHVLQGIPATARTSFVSELCGALVLDLLPMREQKKADCWKMIVGQTVFRRAIEVALVGGLKIVTIGATGAVSPEIKEELLGAQYLGHIRPCPCGNLEDPRAGECVCSTAMVKRHLRSHSIEALREEGEMFVQLMLPASHAFFKESEDWFAVSARIERVANLPSPGWERSAVSFLASAIELVHLTPAEVTKVEHVAETIARHDQKEFVSQIEVLEALQYRWPSSLEGYKR